MCYSCYEAPDSFLPDFKNVSRIRLEVGSEPFPGLKLLQLRGRGGFAEVWEALDKQGRQIAVKFMETRNSASSVKEMRIIQAIQKLSHRYLLRINHVWSIPQYIVVAMELADGSMLDLMDAYQTEYRSPPPPELILRYMRQAAEGLDFLNARQHQFDGRPVSFIHCDVKPSNLLLVGDTLKLADFGLATTMDGRQASYDRAGTPDFAAPEVHGGGLADSSDQYSFAVTYYYLRTGRLPFPTPAGKFQREFSISRPAADLSGVRPGERWVLGRALEMDPTARWPSCTAMMTALTDTFKVGGRSTHSLKLPGASTEPPKPAPTRG
jgi:serine/threonine-protein kinase